MQYNSHATNQDIVSDIKFLLTGKFDGSIDYDIADITRNCNNRLDEVVSAIMRADGRWEFDDNNFSTLPIGTTNLVAGQQDYEISTGDFLNIHEASVLDQNGNKQALKPVDRTRGRKQFLLDLERTENNGLPMYYDKIGNTIMLYPKPSADKTTLNSGLEVVFQRQPSYFDTTDTVKTPGYATTFHRLISYGASIDYCMANGLTNKMTMLQNEYDKMTVAMQEYYADRSKDEQPRMRLQREDYGGMSGVYDSFGTPTGEDRFNSYY